MTEIGEFIREWRQERGMTQREMARALRITPSFISLVERGRKKFGVKVLLALSELTETQVKTLARMNNDNYEQE